MTGSRKIFIALLACLLSVQIVPSLQDEFMTGTYGPDIQWGTMTQTPQPGLSVRLVGGSSSLEGRVEVFHSGTWGTVCHDLWDLNNARVVCKSLGFGGAIDAPRSAAFGQGSGNIWMDNVDCTGNEGSIFDCRHNGFGVHNCMHAYDAGVVCSEDEAYVVCDSTSMTLVMDVSILHVGDDGGDVHFDDYNCIGYTHDTHRVAITTSYDRCATAMEETDDYIVFSNLVTYREPQPENGTSITREHTLLIPVTCNMKREEILSESYIPITGVITYEEVGYGEFTLSLERYQTSGFYQLADDSQEVILSEPLYFGVNMNASVDLTLFIDTCWATPSGYPLFSSNYTMIHDGCADDETIVFYNYFGPLFKGFKIDAFTFIGDYTQVYVHCDILICDNGDPGSRCAQGCVSRKKRSAQSPGSRSTPHTISVGPLSVGQTYNADENRLEDGVGSGTKTTTIAAAGSLIGLVALLVLALMVMLVRMRRRTRTYSEAYQPLLIDGEEVPVEG